MYVRYPGSDDAAYLISRGLRIITKPRHLTGHRVVIVVGRYIGKGRAVGDLFRHVSILRAGGPGDMRL